MCFSTSREGVSYLNKDIVEDIDLQIPDKAVQEQQLRTYSRLKNIEAGCKAILRKIEQVDHLAPAFEYKTMQGRAVPVSDVFECISGNSGLTEEYLYQITNTVRGGERRYTLLTGSTDFDAASLIPRCADPKDADQLITVYEGEGIHVVRKGQAGRIHYLPPGYYTLNDDAYILTLKKNCKLDISLSWVADTQRALFSEYATKSDNGTWSKSAFFEHASLDVPDRQEQNTVTQVTRTVRDIGSQLNELRARIASLLEKELL